MEFKELSGIQEGKKKREFKEKKWEFKGKNNGNLRKKNGNLRKKIRKKT